MGTFKTSPCVSAKRPRVNLSLLNMVSNMIHFMDGLYVFHARNFEAISKSLMP